MSITIQGMDELFKTLDRAAALDKLEAPMKKGLYRLQAFMAQYPSAPSHSKYVRTGTLGKRWTTAPIDRNSNGLVGRIGNNVPYGPWVQSERFQTRWHRRTGWRTDEQAIRENEAAIVADFQQAVSAAIRG
jgi:hypothetical protein